MRIRLSDAKAFLNVSLNTELIEKLPPNPRTGEPYNKSQVTRWGEFLPELIARQLMDQHGDKGLRDHVIDEQVGLTPAEMRSLVKGGA